MLKKFIIITHWLCGIALQNGSVIAIHCIQPEDVITDNMYERPELDHLIYNEPLIYAQLVLNGRIEEYSKGSEVPAAVGDFLYLQMCEPTAAPYTYSLS